MSPLTFLLIKIFIFYLERKSEVALTIGYEDYSDDWGKKENLDIRNDILATYYYFKNFGYTINIFENYDCDIFIDRKDYDKYSNEVEIIDDKRKSTNGILFVIKQPNKIFNQINNEKYPINKFCNRRGFTRSTLESTTSLSHPIKESIYLKFLIGKINGFNFPLKSVREVNEFISRLTQNELNQLFFYTPASELKKIFYDKYYN